MTDKLEQHEAELALITSVQEGLAAKMKMEEIYELVGDKIRDVFDAQVVGIYTFDIDQGMEYFQYVFEDGERINPEPRPFDKFRKKLIDTKKLILINDNLPRHVEKITGTYPEAVPGTELPKSVLFVPLIAGSAVRGCVSLQNLDKEHAFTDSDVRLLGTLTNSMSVALENARLFNETEQRNAELAVINSVQEGLVAEMDMQGIYDLVGDRIRDLFDAQVAAIATFDHEHETETFQYLYENGERMYPDTRPFDKIRQRLITTQKLIDVEENAAEAYTTITGKAPEAVPGTGFPKSMVFVPLSIGDTVRGYVSLQNLDKEHAFSNSDVRLLSTLANSMSVALENARLFNETEQRNAELAVINSVQEGLVAEMDMQGIYDLVGDRIRDLFDAQVTGIVTFDLKEKTEDFKYLFEDGDRLFPSTRAYDKVRGKIIDERTTLLFNNNAAELMSEILGQPHKPVPGTRAAKSALYVPMIVAENVRGYVTLQNLDKENAFSEPDVRLLGTLVNSMSVALENARLFNETEQRNAELAVINSVQEGLVAEMDMQGIYDLVGDQIRDLFDSQVTVIATFDHETKQEYFKYTFEDGKRFYPDPRKYDGVRQRLIDTHKLVHIEENAIEALKKIGASTKAVPGTKLPKSMLYVPLVIGDSVRGYVSLQNLDREHAFSESDVSLLSTLVNSMTVALENARLFNETEQRNAELAVINSVQEGLVAEMDMQGIYDLVGDRIQELFDAQSVIISIFDHKSNLEHFQYNYETGARIFPEPRSIDNVREKLIKTKELILIDENLAQEAAKLLGEDPKAVPGTELPKSVLFVPMIVGEAVRGYVSLQNLDREHAFNDSDVRLLSTLANSMSVALENARLFNETTRLLAETEQRNAELAVINSVQEGLVREMDMQAIYNLVGGRINDVLNTQSLLIRTFNHEKGLENWEYVIENGKRLYSEPRSFIWANKRLIESKEPLVINENYVKTAQKFGGKGVTKGLPPKSAIFVPMIVGDEVIGSVSSQNVEEEHAFSESDVRLLTTLTNSMSVAIENARLFNETTRLLTETEQRASELQTVNSISRALVAQLELDALIELIGEQMRETFDADIVYLAMHDKETDMLHFPYIYGEEAESRPFGNGITEKIIREKEPLLINHDMEEAYDKMQAELKGKLMQSFLGVPILAGKKAIGVISVQSVEQENRFNEYDQRLLSTIAANVAVAMQNAEAYENLQEALTELKSAQEQLVQQEKLASLGQLTAGIAHEIKNPLNFVNNFSDVSIELLQEIRDEMEGLKKSDITEEVGFILNDVEANLKKIHEHGTRADGIVKSMLLHSRGKSGERIPTDLNKLLDEYVKLSYHGMRAVNKSFNIDIQTDYDESIKVMDLVAQDLSRAFLNIINNAMYAAHEYAKQTNGRSPVIGVKTRDTGNYIELRIRDNGPGIPEKIREKIFEPFFTTKPTGEGTGLGLSMTYDIINLHKGTLQIETEPGEFTEFIITLPKK